jgi:hypothetical protein
MGKAGDSFNDIITHLITKAGTIGNWTMKNYYYSLTELSYVDKIGNDYVFVCTSFGVGNIYLQLSLNI